MINNAFVNIWDRRVGAISWDKELGVSSFEFDKDFLNSNWDMSVPEIS